MNKAFPEVSAEPQPMLLCFNGTNAMKTTTVSVFPSCMHAVKNIPPLQPFENVPSSTIRGNKCFAIVQQAGGGARNALTGLFSWSFSIVGLLPHESSCVSCETNSNKFSAGCTLHLLVTRRRVLELLDSVCSLLLKEAQSVHFLSVLPSCLLPFLHLTIFSM